MLIVLFLVSHFYFLFVPCGELSWLPVSIILHVKYTLSYRIVYHNICNKFYRERHYDLRPYGDQHITTKPVVNSRDVIKWMLGTKMASIWYRAQAPHYVYKHEKCAKFT